MVFFVVLVSATLQGWTLPLLATRLGLQEARAPAPPAFLELLALRDVNAEIIDYTVSADSTLAGRTVEALSLPEGAIVALVSRDGALIAPRGSTQLRAGDHLFVIARTEDRDAVNRVLGHDEA